MEFPENAIVIKHIKQTRDGHDNGLVLKDCFFIWFQDSQTYSFCDMLGNGLKQGLRAGDTFSFQLSYGPKADWTLTIFPDSDHQKVGGRWSEPTPINEPEGSYQATAGGGTDEKENAASATV